MVKEKNPSGYQRGSFGHVLYHLRKMGIPETTAGIVTLNDKKQLKLHGKLFATYEYFPSIEKPLFGFEDKIYYTGQMELNLNNGHLIPRFQLWLSEIGQPCFTVIEQEVTVHLRDYIRLVMFSGYSGDAGFEISRMAHAFFKEGYSDPLTDKICVEFWKAGGAQTWIDYMNKVYRSKAAEGAVEPIEQRVSYPGRWEKNKITYVVGDETYEATTRNSQRDPLLGTVEVQEGRVVRFTYETPNAEGSIPLSSVEVMKPELI